MRVAVLAHALRTAGGRSVGLNVLRSMAKVRPHHRVLAIVPDDPDYLEIPYAEGSEVFPYRERGRPGRALFDALTLPRLVASFDPDWILGLGNFGLSRPTGHQAIVLHKAQLVYPIENRPAETAGQRIMNGLIRHKLARSLPKTDIVFCQTDVMRGRFRRQFPRFAGRVELMPNAVSALVDSSRGHAMPAELAACDRPLKLFALTRYYPHKNLELIVDCFDRYRDELSDVACILTISAEQHPGAAKILERIEDLDLARSLVNVGPVDQARLAAFFRHTDALLLPTLLESFSGTYLEAMTFGRPILTSDLDFAHDICGAAALYFDPWDPAALRDAIVSIRDDSSLRVALAAAGRSRRDTHGRSWDEIVEASMTTLEEFSGA